jgi:hypothetical protein
MAGALSRINDGKRNMDGDYTAATKEPYNQFVSAAQPVAGSCFNSDRNARHICPVTKLMRRTPTLGDAMLGLRIGRLLS